MPCSGNTRLSGISCTSVDPDDRATVPKEQFWHANMSSAPFGCCTFQQGTIVSMPVFGQYAPFGHIVHSVDPDDRATVPNEQFDTSTIFSMPCSGSLRLLWLRCSRLPIPSRASSCGSTGSSTVVACGASIVCIGARRGQRCIDGPLV